jgi:hypothetical protein
VILKALYGNFDFSMADLKKETLCLRDAVRQIKQSYEWALSKDRASPFFFVIGAGVSVPQVPLASEIIRQCKEKCGAIEAPKWGTTVMDEYSHWLNEAFHAPEMRQDYFHDLIQGKPIPTANFRLAHLLLGEGMKEPFTSLVVTTNFDNFLSRALSLFGKEHVVCDSPNTAPRHVSSDQKLLQIIHVHGTYQFYDIKNLSGEVEEAAALSEYTIATMAALLDFFLRDKSPIVVGYGGWEGDVFMKSLKRRLQEEDCRSRCIGAAIIGTACGHYLNGWESIIMSGLSSPIRKRRVALRRDSKQQ